MASRSPVGMSDSSDDDDQRKAEPASRLWTESQPGPSRCPPSRQGYCGYCRVLYSNLDQHLSSLRHLDSVRTSSRGSSSVSSSSSRTKLTLLERFLQDVLQHHPHRYNDPRPSHADLPSVSTPPLPRAELDEVHVSDDDSRSLGTRENLPSSDASCQPAHQQEEEGTRSQSGERLSAPIREQEEAIVPMACTHSPHSQALPPPYQTLPPVHRKAHRKTNRRKTSSSSGSSRPPRGPGPGPHQDLSSSPSPGPGISLGPRPQDPTQLRPGLGPNTRPRAPTDLRPWLSWQKVRREVHKEEAFSSDHSDLQDQTIEEVIQMCCHGNSPPPCQQETDSFQLSLPVSMETQSEDWDSPVQVVFQRGRTPSATPVQVSQTEGRDLSRLMDFQVDLEDQVYSYQLDSALRSERRSGQDQGFWTLPIEEVLPAPEHIPESFRGKTWAQIEQEDEARVDKLVRQFRRGRFICYFDSESLARYGRRSHSKKGRDEAEGAEPDEGVLPLLDHHDNDSAYVRRRRRRRGFRLASRCQVVQVSHSTQTVRLFVPAVHHLVPEAPPTSVSAANQDAAERTPEAQTWRCLPPSYSNIVTPVQPCTSLVYLLSPTGPAPICTPAAGSTTKRCRKKRRPLDLQGLKVKYKRLPVRFYEPGTNRILKTPPKGCLRRRGPATSCTPPPCVRQLFRSLSPDLNTDRPPTGEGATGSSRVKGHRSSDPPFSHSSSFLLSTLSKDSAQTHLVRRRGRTSQAPPLDSRSERGRGGRRERTRPPPSKRRSKSQATPPQPRREGLRQAGPGRKLPGSRSPAPLNPTPPHPPSSRRGRGRKGRGR